MRLQPADFPWYGWVAAAALLMTQATWIFLDARRRGARPWLWGLIGLVSCPGSLLLYWAVVIFPRKK